MEENEDLQLTINLLDDEIKRELQTDAENSNKNAGAQDGEKQFEIHEFDPPKDREMAVFTHAKKLSEYIFVITEKSPKKLRWSIVTRLQNTSVDIIENLYRANYERDVQKRLEHQRSALVYLNLIDFYTETAKRKLAINNRQTAIIARQVSEIKKLLMGWIKSSRPKND